MIHALTSLQLKSASLSIYDLLLTPGMKEITMSLFDQNYESQQNLILFFFQVSPFVRVGNPYIKQEKQQGFQ